MQDTRALLLETDFPAMRRLGVDTLQANLGYRCNQSCAHCHVNAGPSRTEAMDRDTVDLLLDVAARHRVATLDLTGGALELNLVYHRSEERRVGQECRSRGSPYH